jgi:hypothetical protein
VILSPISELRSCRAKSRHRSVSLSFSASRLRSRRTAFLGLALTLISAPLLAKDRLGAYQSWAAFKDADVPRCYAIGAPEESSGEGGYVSIGFWPKRGLTHQVYVRLSRARNRDAGITLTAGGRRFQLKTDGNGGWAKDRTMDLAIIAAMRSSQSMSVQSSGVIDAYALRGAASAIDAAALGCARK